MIPSYDILSTFWMLSSDARIVINASRSVLFINPKISELTGWRQEELVGRPYSVLFQQDNELKQLDSHMNTLGGSQDSYEIQALLSAKNGNLFTLDWKVFKCGTEICFQGIDHSLADFYKSALMRCEAGQTRTKQNELLALRAKYRSLKKLAQKDHLTGLYNRRYLDEQLPYLLDEHRIHNDQLSVLMCDLDRFKEYNDKYGHIAGDLALKKAAETFNSCTHRRDDMAVRYGGEEFVIILPDTDFDGAQRVAKCILNTLYEKQIVHEHSEHGHRLTVSIGMITISANAVSDAKELIAMADQQLYKAKRKGRNTISALQLIDSFSDMNDG